MKTKHGEVIDLHFPDGNDDRELFVRGHLPDEDAREAAMAAIELEGWACDQLFDEGSEPVGAPVERRMRDLLAPARIEHVYARWSQESYADEHELTAILRTYRSPGRGRFPVTRLTLAPRPPCSMTWSPLTKVYTCRACHRRFTGPNHDDHRISLRGPKCCDRLRGDEVGPFTEVWTELIPVKERNTA